VFFGTRSDPELKAAQAQKSELSRDELREFLTEVILTPAGKAMSNQGYVDSTRLPGFVKSECPTNSGPSSSSSVKP
jgi:hypothetical protein